MAGALFDKRRLHLRADGHHPVTARVWNLHPLGSLSGDGTSLLSSILSLPWGRRLATADRAPQHRAPEDFGRIQSSLPGLMSFPRYITPTRSEMPDH